MLCSENVVLHYHHCDSKQIVLSILACGCGVVGFRFVLQHWFGELIIVNHRVECVTGCTTIVEMVHCHPPLASPPHLPFCSCCLLPYFAVLLLIQTWPWSAVCVCVCVCVGT